MEIPGDLAQLAETLQDHTTKMSLDNLQFPVCEMSILRSLILGVWKSKIAQLRLN